MNAPTRLKVLFLCTGNSCRSQMAEGWARQMKGECIDAYSCGIEPRGLDARAVRVMAEAGVDISGQRSKGLAELAGIEFDYVVTLCGHARESCPAFPGKTKVLHFGFEDPAAAEGSEQDVLATFRRVRDQIKAFVARLPEALKQGSKE